MHLKSLTVRGFKSFASATELQFEPGITCVVGPNGSGKSNVVDALAWVMGEQGAKTLRGGKMEDVIFAGTSGRPPLGRAEVTLTIDNTDGALPIEYAEVTISRTMFRGGGSEYTINGTSCRLLDVQELLSDSGIGREMHVIVGQGQLDTVLRATPEDRRGFIEEAAGVLKHRKRKEKALRKLDAMQVNLTRLSDLIAEIRRQLGPLGRQAEVARKAVVIQTDVRDARLRLLADDLVQLMSALEAEMADEALIRAQRVEVEEALMESRRQLADLEELSQAHAPLAAQTQETWYRLSALAERLRSTAGVAAERRRLLAEENSAPKVVGRDPDQLAAQAKELRIQEVNLTEQVRQHATTVAEAVAARQQAEHQAATAAREFLERQQALADRREGVARLTGQIETRRSRIDAAEAEVARLTAAMTQAQAQGAEAEQEFVDLEAQIAGMEHGTAGIDTEHEAADEQVRVLREQVTRCEEEERAAHRERLTWAARLEALELGLNRKDGTGHLMASSPQLDGLMGAVASLIHIHPGQEVAISAALGVAADALAVTSQDVAVRAIQTLREHDAGQVVLLTAGVDKTPGDIAPRPRPALPAGTQWACDLVRVDALIEPVVHRFLRDTVIVESLDDATSLVANLPHCTAVTVEGDVVAAGIVRGGSAAAPSLVQVQAAVDEARAAVSAATQREAAAATALGELRQQVTQAQGQVDAAMAKLHDADAQYAAVAERLAQLGATVRSAGAEVQRLAEAKVSASSTIAADHDDLASLTDRLIAANEEPDTHAELSPGGRDRADEDAKNARAAETEARLALRTAEEQVHAIASRAQALERSARHEREARERDAARRERRRREAAAADAVQRAAEYTGQRLAVSLQQATLERDSAAQEREHRELQLTAIRARLRELEDRLRELTDSVHRDEVARAEQRLRIEQVQSRALEELGIDAEALVDEYGPHQLVPPSLPAPGDPEPDEPPRPQPYQRAVQEKRLRKAERALNQLGRVNPLALEEFTALEERHRFLTTQMADLNRSRRDLMDIIKEVDERVEQVFAAAFADTAVQFERVFDRLFPGGQGRLVLTDPGDMLTTGIEVEARPPGKKVKRLSLLSGGERSLTAVALLVAIFKARPSPFYVLDEVEAALDDTNLGRLIVLMEELRESSQLIVITHQKRTMEIADALYGVTMRGDGVTTVISQRLREAATV
ncbi:MAG: chromosome segregation protein SMC [Actinomycetota bacterium]